MIAALTKNINDLKQEDLEELVAKGWSENENVEFKVKLAAAPKAEDPWYTGGKVGNFAKEKLFKEVVAFANRSGGRLFLGLQEWPDKPPRAAKITPVPKCHDLAEILERSARDLIEPPLSSFRAHSVVTESDGSSGVVVLEVGPSVAAPHRSKLDRQCYIRRGTESRPMTMTEIQDLTLHLSRHLDEVTKRFENQREIFEKWLYRAKPTTHRFMGLRVTAIPAGARLYIPRVFKNPDVVTPVRELGGTSKGAWNLPFVVFSPFDPGNTERSVLRGTRRSSDDALSATYYTVWRDGVIEIGHNEYWDRADQNRLYLSNIIGSLANVAVGVERFRTAAATPDVEYAIEIELACGGLGDSSDLRIIAFTGEPVGTMKASEMPLLIEGVGLGDKEEAVNSVLADILGVCEYPHLPRPGLTIKWA